MVSTLDGRSTSRSSPDDVEQRVFQIAMGYEDQNDATSLRLDPAWKVACDRDADEADALSSQPSLLRFEHAMTARAVVSLTRSMEDEYVASLPADTTEVVLDLDSTDDPTHGQQPLSFFNAHYDSYIYFPLLGVRWRGSARGHAVAPGQRRQQPLRRTLDRQARWQAQGSLPARSHPGALRFLDLHHLSELGRPPRFSSTNDLRLGLEDADDLLGGLGVALEHALFGLRHDLLSHFGESSQISTASLRSARKRTATPPRALHCFDGLSDCPTDGREWSSVGSLQRASCGFELHAEPRRVERRARKRCEAQDPRAVVRGGPSSLRLKPCPRRFGRSADTPVAFHLPLELLVDPILQVHENQHPKRHFRWRPMPTTTPALRKATAHRLEHGIDQRVIFQNFIDAMKPRIHLLLGL